MTRSLPQLVFVVMSALWMVPMFTQSYKHYPYLGSLVLPMAGLGVAFAVASLGAFFAAGGTKKQSRKSGVMSAVGLVVLSVVGAILWAPVLNAWLDFGPTRVVDGEIEVIENPGKGNASRRVSARVDGDQRMGAFHPHAGFWDVPVVRSGGTAKLTVGTGFFGVPWIRTFEDAS